MRLNSVRPKKVKHKEDETRVVTKFLWFPKEIDREIRWLEKATYKQVYWGATLGWHDLWWVNK